MKKRAKTCLVLMMLTLFGINMAACGDTDLFYALDGGAAEPDTEHRSIIVDSLEDYSDDRECWISIPDSEIVINPFDYSSDSNFASDRRQTEYFDRANMSIDLGILDYSSTGKRIENGLGCAAVNPYGGHIFAKKGFRYGWRPDRLMYEATYDSGLSITAYDYFYDSNTIVRNMTLNEKTVVVWGGFAAGAANFLRLQDNVFLYRRADGITVGIATSCSGTWGFYASESDFLAGNNVQEVPDQTGVWCFSPDRTSIVSVSIAIGGFGEQTADVVSRAKRPFEQNDFVKQAGYREKAWNVLLSSCPLPETFAFSKDFNSYNISEETVRSYYYRSWTAIISNVLPKNEQFSYRTISVGKASMWSAGDPNAKYSAVWEALYGVQMYSFIDADIAWELCLGIMSLIPEDGNLLGESLPSNKAHTVWQCYVAQRDKDKLEECIEPLTNYLNWRYENPRWILQGAHDISDERDIDFVAAYLVDLKFMVKICRELGKTTEAAYWQNKADSMYTNMCKWFFQSDVPVQYYYEDGGTTASGTPLWITKSLWVNQLDGEDLQKVFAFAISQYNVNKAFAGFGGVKYDDWAFTLYGFVKNGRGDIAANMVEALLRDIPRSGFIGELYNANWRGTVCEGVRPSLFGAILMIDNVWLRNGFMYHEGGIGVINLFEGESGIIGIRLDGKEFSLHVDGNNNEYTVTTNDQELKNEIPKGSYLDPVI